MSSDPERADAQRLIVLHHLYAADPWNARKLTELRVIAAGMARLQHLCARCAGHNIGAAQLLQRRDSTGVVEVHMRI